MFPERSPENNVCRVAPFLFSQYPCRTIIGPKPLKEDNMDNTTLLIIIVILLLVGGGWYGRGRWY
jgi:hypothetical protein